GAADIAVEPATTIVAPIAGTVARAGNYTLYCRYQDGFVVINPDGRPDLEVKLLHVQGVAVQPGDRVEVGQTVATNATLFPFQSQIDELTGEPSWPHVHIEVVDPSIPRPPSSGSC
ncbi:MAG: M23 family metallopeptidase, partial [Actinomycetota bacterium]